jgi:hypothetical protein
MKKLQAYRVELGITSDFHEMTLEQLGEFLCSFFISAKKTANGDEDYEPGTLSAIHLSLGRHLREKGYPHDLKRRPAFTKHRSILQAKMNLLKQSRSKTKQSKQPRFHPQNIDTLFEKKVFGSGMLPAVLIYKLKFCVFVRVS